MKKTSKWLALMLSIIMIASIGLVGCGGGTDNETAGDKEGNVEQHLKLNAETEPPSLDPGLATDSTSFEILRVIMEGLVRLDENGKVNQGSGMAESWEINEDGTVYTFKIKEEVKWTNGDPVTANDFEYAWKRVLNPETASDYAYQLYYVKNGEAYNNGQATADEVGVKALDEKTLEVTLEAPTPYFLQLTAFGTLYPVNQKVVEADANWAADSATYVGNGPFKLTDWAHDSEVVVEKNADYWNKDAVKLDKISWAMVNDENTSYQLYQNQDLHVVAPPTDLTMELIEQGEAEALPISGTYYYVFNTEKEPFNNANIRKAFTAAIDREGIVNAVTRGGQLPATGFVPPGSSTDLPQDLRDANGNLIPSVDEAKSYLDKGMQELGITELPEITITYNTSEGHKKIAEAIASMWKTNLGVEVSLYNQEWKVFLDTIDAGDFHVGRMGWLGDYMDPMSFLDLFVTDGGNNYPGYSNPEYDALIAQAKSTNDQQVRLDTMAQAEKILMEDMPILPIYFYTEVYMQHDNVKGVVRHGDGAVDYTWTVIE